MIICASGWINGFVTSISLKSFGIADMIRGSTFSAFIYPTTIFICCIGVDVIETIDHSNAAMPLLSVLCYGCVMMSLSVACCYHGAMTGYTSGEIISLQRVNPVKRKVPDMPCYMKKRIVMPIGGAVIFGSIFFELTYVWDSIWGNRLYAMFGSLLLVMALLVFVIGELSVVHTYFLL
jgi:transmembrane 9 superfamily protein 2/4